MYAAIPLSMQLSSMGALFQNLLVPFSWGMLGGIKVTYDVKHRHLTDKERLVLSVALPLFIGMLTTQLAIDSSRRLYQYNVKVKPLLPPRRRQRMPNPKALPIALNILFLFPIPLFYGTRISEHLQAFGSFDEWLRAATCYDVAQRLIKGEATGTWQGAWEKLTRDFHQCLQDRRERPISLEEDKPISRDAKGYTRLLLLYEVLWEKIQTTVSQNDKTHAWFEQNVKYFTYHQRSSEPNNETVKELRKCVRKYQLFFHPDRANQKGYTYHDEINKLVTRMTTWCDQYLDKERNT